MKLRTQLALGYGGIVALCLLLLGLLGYHELCTEARIREQLGVANFPDTKWGDYIEVGAYAVIPVVLFAGWLLMRRNLAPVERLTKAIAQVEVQNLQILLPRDQSLDEVDQLTAVLNSMITRLDGSFQQIREFTLHASHELKTPLTVMRGELEIALKDEPHDLAAHHEVFHSLLAEVARLTKIVDGLTLLTKADAGMVQLERQPVRLAELVQESFEDARILAEARSVRVRLAECANVTVRGDRHRLRQLFLNLVDNAIKYNCDGGDVTLALRRVDDDAEFTIANTGDGIPLDLQARVFDRFVRGDEARNQAIDGSGLGLTNVQWIAQAHGGTIQLESEPGLVTTAILRLPLTEAAAPSAG